MKGKLVSRFLLLEWPKSGTELDITEEPKKDGNAAWDLSLQTHHLEGGSDS